MKKYEKPMMQIERYSAANAVATGCYEVETTVFPAQTVSCVINGSENIFDTDQTGSSCKNDVNSGYLGTYNGQYYFVWYNGDVNGQPTAAQTAELTAIEKAVMGTDFSKAEGKHGWHAASVDYSTYSKMNATS